MDTPVISMLAVKFQNNMGFTHGTPISYVNQNITYSDNERVSYGVYLLKKCNDSNSGHRDTFDYRPNGHGGCVPQRSNVC